MEKRIIFDTAVESAKVVVEYAPYGFNVSIQSPNSKRCIFCLGDSNIGCVVARKKSKDTADVTYCHPFKVPAELTYPSLKWSNIAREFRMTQKTPNGRYLIAKPMVDMKKEKINGVRFLCAEDDNHEAMNVVELMLTEDVKDRVSLKTVLKAYVVNPDV